MSSKKWNKKEIPDQTGKVVITTGANSGTGYEFSRIMAQYGAHVILACRNLEKGDKAKEKILKKYQNASLDLIQLDLASLSSVREFATKIKEKYDQIDVLCNNAGIMVAPDVKTEDGFDLQFGTNHLGHFALTALLFEKIAPDGRIVTMSSDAHRSGEIHFDDINLEKSFGRIKAYGQSKLANLLFAYELARKIEQKNLDIKSLGAHPGYAATNLQTTGLHVNRGRLTRPIITVGAKIANLIFAQSAEKGSYPLLMAATSPKVKNGDYIGPARFGGTRGYPKVVKSNDKSYDKERARKLWEISEDLTNVKFEIYNS